MPVIGLEDNEVDIHNALIEAEYSKESILTLLMNGAKLSDLELVSLSGKEVLEELLPEDDGLGELEDPNDIQERINQLEEELTELKAYRDNGELQTLDQTDNQPVGEIIDDIKEKNKP